MKRFQAIFFLLVISLVNFQGELSWAKKRVRQRVSSTTRPHVPFCRGGVTSTQTPADQSPVAKQCSAESKAKHVRTFTCIQWVAQQAEKAFEREPACKNRVTTPMLMCIFKREVGHYANNPCGKNGCGLSQFTTAGVSYVKQAFSGGLSDNYDYFWDLVGRPREKTNKCLLNRKHALDRDTAVVMAATHLCSEAKTEGLRSTFAMAQRYNGHPRYKNAYGRFVASCVNNGVWKSNSPAQQTKVAVKSQCKRYRTCGGRKLSSKKYAGYRSSKRQHHHHGSRRGNI